MKKQTKQAVKKTQKIEAKKVERNYTLSVEKVKALRAAKGFPNPYNRGAYHATVEALSTCKGKWLTLPGFKVLFQKAMGERFKAFSSRKPRNSNGKDLDGRILQNLVTLQRKDFGAKLGQVGYKIETEKDAKGIKVRLAPVK